MPEQIREILCRCSFFTALDDRGLDQLVNMAGIHQYDEGDIIFRQDDPCPGVFVMHRGMVHIYRLSPAGKQHTLHLAGPEQTFAEVAVLGRFDNPAFAEALEPTTCVLLPKDAFLNAIETDHALCLGIMTSMAKWVRQLVGLLEDITLRDAMGRVAAHLTNDYASNQIVYLPGQKRHLASHLNLTSETLSRTLRRLSDAGMIRNTRHGGIELLDIEALQRVIDEH